MTVDVEKNVRLTLPQVDATAGTTPSFLLLPLAYTEGALVPFLSVLRYGHQTLAQVVYLMCCEFRRILYDLLLYTSL